jgi:hypothetical protein
MDGWRRLFYGLAPQGKRVLLWGVLLGAVLGLVTRERIKIEKIGEIGTKMRRKRVGNGAMAGNNNGFRAMASGLLLVF